MSAHDDGGPAFPWGEYGTHLGGMTLRDYFAAKALPALVESCSGGVSFGTESPENNLIFALVAYLMADAMLKARQPATGEQT